MAQPRFPDTPEGKRPLLFRVKQFGGFSTNVPRSSLQDNQFFWLENLMPVGQAWGNLRAMYAESSSLITPASSIINAYFPVIAGVPYAILFLSSGSATQYQITAPHTVTNFGSPNLFFTGGTPYPPVAVQWNASGIVIVSTRSTNAFWAWDGTTLTSNGSPAPTWLTDGAVTAMPSGVYGNAVEVYQNRLWVATPTDLGATQAELQTSAPGNGADFSPADGAVINPQQDASLKVRFTSLQQSNGYLYYFGDSSVGAIYNVQTSGTPPVTTYNNQNVDPQVGCAFKNTMQPMGNTVVFANQQGVYQLSGGVVTKVSYELDRIFASIGLANNSAAAVTNIFGVKCYCILLQGAQDFAGNFRNFFCIWDTQKWWVASTLSSTMVLAWTQEFNGIMTAYGSDQTSLFALFQTPTNSLTKKLVSKLWSGGQQDEDFMSFKKIYRVYLSGKDYSNAGFTVSGTVDTVALAASDSGSTTASIPSLSVGNSAIAVTGGDVSAYGRLVGATLNFTGSDFVVSDFALEGTDDAPFLG